MKLLRALSETALGRALIAYFVDLPRFTFMNIMFAIALVPAYVAFIQGLYLLVGFATLPAVLVLVGMINLTASKTVQNAPRLRDIFAFPSTLLAMFILWLVVIFAQILIFAGIPLMAIFILGLVLFPLFMIGVFAIYLPSQLKVHGLLIWRNALVLVVNYPIVALGLVVLGGIGIWAIWISHGALIVVVPALWVLLGAFTVDDRIKCMQVTQAS